MVQFMAKFDGLPVHGMTCDAIAASHIVNFDYKFQHDFDDIDISSDMHTSPHRTSLLTIMKSTLHWLPTDLLH